MPSASSRLFFFFSLSAHVACTLAADCCFVIRFADQMLTLRYNDSTQTVGCGLSGKYLPGTQCFVENSKTAAGDIQAVANVNFGSSRTPFKYRIGVDPHKCKTLPPQRVQTGFEGWGRQLFLGYVATEDLLEWCTSAYSVAAPVPVATIDAAASASARAPARAKASSPSNATTRPRPPAAANTTTARAPTAPSAAPLLLDPARPAGADNNLAMPGPAQAPAAPPAAQPS